MIQITPQMRVLVAIEPVDFCKGIDGLVRVCRERLAADPFSGVVFVFRSRKATASELEAHELSVLIAGGDPTKACGVPIWRQVKAAA